MNQSIKGKTKWRTCMADETPFNKLHVEPSVKGDLTGLLEHFNLPPNVIKFIRKNLKVIYVVLALMVIAILSWSAYDAYIQKRINMSSSALTNALKEPAAVRPAALQKVLADYSGMSSARWAKVELAHIDMKNGNFKAAAEKYADIRREIKQTDPLFGLVSFGTAQAKEAEKDYDRAFDEYTALSKIEGYQPVGLLGMARIHEIKGEQEKALSVYEQYMATFVGDDRNDPEKAFISEKIGRLKAMQ
jgi:predicted negative regulator of RcsB-dependent stress response